MADPKPAPSKPGPRKLLVVVLLALVFVLGAGAAGAWLLLGRGIPAAGAHAVAAAKPAPPAKPVFFKLDPFTVNLQGSDTGGQLLYVGITVELGDDATKSFLDEHLPQVRNRMLMILSGQDANSLVTSEGKQRLAATLRDAIVQPFEKGQPALAVGSVLFTQFIVQ